MTSEGIHWLCLMLLVSVPWCRRQWALPVISVPTPLSCDQRQTRQTASHDDTGGTAPDLARETLVSRARARGGGRRRFCRDQPGSYVPELSSPLYLALALDRTILRSRPAATQGQAGSQAQKGSPPTEADAAFNDPGDSLAQSRDHLVCQIFGDKELGRRVRRRRLG